jgi:hypothetical protein
MNSTRALQLILPTDKRNPSFTLYQDDTEQRIHVYYGLELLQVVPADRQHVQYKLPVANLYNAGLKVISLENLFAVNWGSIRSPAPAPRHRNPRKAGVSHRLVRSSFACSFPNPQFRLT